MSEILVDTDVMIDFLRNQPAAVAFIRKNAGRMAISAVTEAELYSGVREGAERQALEAFLGLIPVVAVNREIARAAGLLRRDFGKATKIGLADAVIAATSRVGRLRLHTLNTKHFPMLPDVVRPYRKN
jgi:predicted nucleic acid-binding protein